MRLPSLAARIVSVAVFCAAVGYVCARVTWSTVLREAIAQFHQPLAEHVWATSERARCEAAPATWSMALDKGAASFAYDAETGTSQNPAAPPLEIALWERVRSGPQRVAISTRGLWLRSGGVLVRRAAADGPCAIVQTTWPPRPISGKLPIWFALSIVFAALGAGTLGLLLLARPVEEVERRRQQLQQHLADVAHDLRTPISSLHLAIEQALDENRDAALAPVLTSVLGDVVYLSALTSNLRLASEMRDGWSPGCPSVAADLREVVERVVGRARLFAKRNGIHLECAAPDRAVSVACDLVAAEQALSNLVENAVIHGASGGHVAVLLDVADGRFSLAVVDDGPGVPPGVLPRLGERTFRSDEARQRDPRGSGLGLAITGEVCARCGWTLSFAAEAPRGLRVTIAGRTLDGTAR